MENLHKESWRFLFVCILASVATTLGFQAIPAAQTTRWTSFHQQLRFHHPALRVSSPLYISNLLGGPQQDKKAQMPRDVKDAVSKCRQAVQNALQKQISRMDIEMPVGTKFGVEKTSKGKRGGSSDVDGAPTRDMLDQSDRELARLFVEMFQPVGSDRIAVIFKDQNLADATKRKWKGDPDASISRVLAIDRKSKGGASSSSGKRKKGKGMGFAAKMQAEVGDKDSSGPFALPDNIEVALFVAPGVKELIQIEKVCNEVGMGTLVILLNARLSNIPKFASDEAKSLFMDEFEPVFGLSAAPQQEAPGCLLFRSFPGEWVLARKPKVGQPKPILVQESRPTAEECSQAYDSLELSDVEKGVENVIENVAGWFS